MKRILLVLIFFLVISSPVFAEKISVRIEPVNVISTHHDEIELGDIIKFNVTNDVYLNDKLYITAGTPIYSRVDFFHPTGWAGDCAEIRYNDYKTKSVNNELVEIHYPVIIDGNDIKSNDSRIFLSNLFFPFIRFMAFIRGAEIYLEPDEKPINLFIEQ